jgi:ATP-binding cassette subfamily B protein
MQPGLFCTEEKRGGVMKSIRSYLKKYWGAYVFATVCMLLAIFLDMLYPQITKIIVNEVFIGGDFSRFAWLLAAIVVIGIGRSVFGYLKEFTFDRNCISIGTRMRKDLFNHIQGLSMDYFDETNTGELMARVKDDIDNVWRALGMTAMLIIEVTVHIVSVLYCMFALNWKLTFVPLAFMIVGAGIGFVLEKKLDQVYEDISEENAAMTTVAEENLAGVRTVKAFAREEFEIKKFLNHNSRYYDLNMNQTKVLVRYYPIYQFIGAVLPVLCAVLGGFMVVKGEMDLGSLVAYVEYTRNCTWPLEMIAELANEISSSVASYKKIKKISDKTADLVEAEHPIHLEKINGDIVFDHVSLKLQDKLILDDINFSVPKGKTLGIMGATGSGKSSVINLLQRFYDPTEGTVLIDGTDAKEMELAQVRGTSAVVMQDVFLFSDTIEENIKMGQRETLGLPAVQKAAKMAKASDFIEKMDDSYETVIGERGVGLSGGQRQRISIARAFSKKSPVLVLDDSTSALDMETEHEIQKELDKITDTSKIIIAHRISAVRRADEILYLEDGRIAERGTHEELLAKKGLYYRTYVCQYGEVS